MKKKIALIITIAVCIVSVSANVYQYRVIRNKDAQIVWNQTTEDQMFQGILGHIQEEILYLQTCEPDSDPSGVNKGETEAMPEIKNVTRKTENPYVNLYELETKDRVGHDKHYYVASRAKTAEDLKLSTHNEKPDGVIIYGLTPEKDKVLLVRQYRYSLDRLPYKLEQLEKAGVNSIMLFGIPDHKDEVGSGAYAQDGIVQKALREAKSRFPEMYYVTDVCMCEYTSHGHCGVLCGHDVDNDKTLELLAKTALSHAQAGSDMIAPSDMMDGRVAAIRKELDLGGYTNIPIMSYAVKYASAFYGPFRDAAGSAPAFGDRKSYQMDFHNRREGMKEALMDIEEGADIIMVKPAMSYLDMVSEISKAVNVPVAAYSVSGEYAMVKAAAKMGWIDEERIIGEMAVGAYRAGAQIYITYFAEEIAKMMEEGRIG